LRTSITTQSTQLKAKLPTLKAISRYSTISSNCKPNTYGTTTFKRQWVSIEHSRFVRS